MSSRLFLDTNIFIYSFDDTQPGKMDLARGLIAEALVRGNAIISTQVVQEFLNVATRKFANPFTPKDAKEYLHRVLNPLCQIYPDLDLYETCLDLQNETGYSFYDSLVLAAALRGECNLLLSKDLQDGQFVRSMRITNPFAA
jgi:predicted nucleic acid-binding protein